MTFDPSSLFASAEAGAWYDPSDLATLYQDSAGTNPVTQAGQPVGRIADKSGNGKHLTQSAAANCPLYQVDSGGRAYLSFDGVNDLLAAPLGLSLPFDRVSAIRQLSWTGQDRIYDGGASSGRLYQNGTSPQLRIFDGGTEEVVRNAALAVGATGVVVERHVAGASKLGINDGPLVAGDAGSVSPTSLYVGATASSTSAGQFSFYGMVMRGGALSDEQIDGLRDWMAERAGVSFTERRPSRHSSWY